MGGERQLAGVDEDGDGVPDGVDSHPKDGAQNESVNEEELEERKKRDTPRDADRREAEKLKINEEELEEMHCGDRDEEEELEEAQEEVVEETISNDEWYQSELYESLKKRWTK